MFIEILRFDPEMIIYLTQYCTTIKRNKITTIKAFTHECYGEIDVVKRTYIYYPEYYTSLIKKISREEDFHFLVKFTCGGCFKEFESYHDGIGFNTGFCPICLDRHETIGLEEKPK